jgi:hypothetical protein
MGFEVTDDKDASNNDHYTLRLGDAGWAGEDQRTKTG